MALYSVLLKPGRTDFLSTITPHEQKTVAEHFEYLKDLMKKGKLLFAGRAAGASFGIAVMDVESKEEMIRILENDPCISNGIFTWEVDQFSFALLDIEAMTTYATA